MSISLSQQARNVAATGRYGDTTLLHLNPDELRGIASVVPLTINPQTGYAEAFLPLLAAAPAIAPAVLGGAAAAAPVIAATAAPAIAAGTGAAGLGALGTAGALGGAGAGATTLGTTLGATGGALGATGGALGATGGTLGGGALGLGGPLAEGITTGILAGGTGGGAAPVGFNVGANMGATMAPTATMTPAAAPAATGIPTATLPTGAPSAGVIPKAGPIAGRALPGASKGGIGSLLGKNKMALAAAGIPAAMSLMGGRGGGPDEREGRPYSRQRVERDAVGPQAPSPTGVERRHVAPARYVPYAQGGLVRGYAQGGLASLGGGQQAGPTGEDMAVMSGAVQAIRGAHPDPKMAIQAFIQRFGAPAFEALMKREMAAQQSNGTSDSIPAINPDGAQAALSEGEYIMPAQTVSALGNGSTEAGGRALDGMVASMRGNGPMSGSPPDQIDPRMMGG